MTLKDAISYYYDHLDAFVEDIILQSKKTGVYPTKQQYSVLKELPSKRHITVKSGHGTGKTALEAWIILWFMATRPHCRIPCTAPTQPQLYDVLWTELKKWQDSSLIKSMFEHTRTHLFNKNNPHTWFAVARSSNKPENMQGFHADHLLFVIDEASGVAQEIMEAVQGALTNENAYSVMFGNPTQLSGTFYDSFHKDRASWTQFTFNSEESENVHPDYIDRMTRKYGKESNIYRVRVLGEFPKSEDDTVISLSDVEKAVVNDVQDNEQLPVYIGCDVARFGNDKTVIVVRRGNKVLSLQDKYQLSTMDTCGYLMMEINKYLIKSPQIFVNIDDSGVGGGVVDRMRELTQSMPTVIINGINNGSTAEASDKYVNRGTELWFNIRENIRLWQIPNDEELIAQLSTRRYGFTNAKLMLERKDDMKKRGLDSPDKADALALAFANTVESGAVIVW